ncbi:hypothetical protein BCF44_104423 [Kutzneria buriramensis]|uniref:PH (Pleckstrin Homology) domain-containing protein n=2 Tax=Kutzneria buriramensis TaxID=1045776 RepID=A0A3E0HUQ8_9PSEU|nr:hypothetical protein BCF44_104423 [Kutzneria buriramensis]
MSEPAVYRCSLRNGRVSYLVSVMGLLTAGVLAAGLLGGGVAGRGVGQLLAWLAVVVLVVGPTIAYLRRTRIVIDAEQVRVHTLVGVAGSARRAAVAKVIVPRSGIGFFVDADGKVLVPFRDAYTREQLAAMAGVLGVDLVTTGKSK